MAHPRNRHTRGNKQLSRFRRQLRCESLETRRLLAADLMMRHNVFDPEDVNDDGLVSPIDALAIINVLNHANRSVETDLVFADVNNDGAHSPLDVLMVINRVNQGGSHGGQFRPGQPQAGQPEANQPSPTTTVEIRSLDGTGNNLSNPSLGSTGQALLRQADSEYSDGISAPAGLDRPSAREISNVLSDHGSVTESSERQLSAFVYVWGQFLDHDIDLTETSEAESFAIEVPEGDPQFDPSGSGDQLIPFTRSQFDATTGTSVDNPREQVSSITAWIDGSQVYGSDAETAASLREFSGGRLLMSDGDLLPTDANGFFLAGDIRVNENTELSAIQTLWMREHNYWANRIAAQDPGLSDEAIYQKARGLVIAEIQSITYNEFLPALLGKNALGRYQGYDATVDPTIANEFSTAAFRFGHSTLNDDIEFFGNDGRAVRDEVSLSEAFFNPSLLQETGIDSVLKYVASSQSEEVDLKVVDSLRNLLFGPPGAGGLDLAALNIQRGRDHGLADYNSVRDAYGLERVDGFDDITSDTDLQASLESLYGSVDNIDLWVGILAEDHVQGASIGELGKTIIVDQFQRLRDGDRLWFENSFSGNQLRQLQNTQLSDIIQRNTGVTNLQDNVFFMRAEVSGTVLLADPNATNLGNHSRGGQPTRAQPASGVVLELLDDEGTVIATTTTDARGRYRFTEFRETGDYSVQLAADSGYSSQADSIEFLVSNGATRLRGLDFRVSRI